MKIWLKTNNMNTMAKEEQIIEKVLWSIALPGFAQILNGKLLKGLLFIALEFVINVNSHFNEVIRLSFMTKIEEAIAQTNYQWLMFYPCVYMFAMWDAYKDAGGGKEKYSYLPFVCSAYFLTVGLIFSSKITIAGKLLGPMWTPFLFLPIGILVGIAIKRTLLKIGRIDC